MELEQYLDDGLYWRRPGSGARTMRRREGAESHPLITPTTAQGWKGYVNSSLVYWMLAFNALGAIAHTVGVFASAACVLTVGWREF